MKRTLGVILLSIGIAIILALLFYKSGFRIYKEYSVENPQYMEELPSSAFISPSPTSTPSATLTPVASITAARKK